MAKIIIIDIVRTRKFDQKSKIVNACGQITN